MEAGETGPGSCRLPWSHPSTDLPDHLILPEEGLSSVSPAAGEAADTPHTTETEQLVLAAHDRYSLGAVHLEQKIEEESGIHVPHSTIHRILLTHGRVEVSMKKRKQRKWVRYERDHATSLWQGDWKQITVDG